MANNTKHLYWDADVILSYLNKNATRHKILSSIIDEVRNNSEGIKIITSATSKAEVFYLKDGDTLDISNDAIDKIDDFFHDRSLIDLVTINEQVVDVARQLKFDLKKQGKSLNFADTIHLATAKWMKVYEFQSYNMKHFAKAASLVPFPINEPSVSQNALFVMSRCSP